MTRRNYRVAAGVAAGLGAITVLLGACQSTAAPSGSVGSGETAGAGATSGADASTAVVPADLAKAPQTINNSGQKGLVYDCAGQEITINGSLNSLTLLGTCRQVTVNGSSNELGVAAATAIIINGDSNRVTHGGDPQVSDNGSGNDLRRGTVSAPSGGSGTGDTGEGANIPGGGAGPAPEQILGSGLNASYDCANRRVSVLGSDSTIRLTGICRSVSIAGSSNTIKVSAVGEITVLGNGNRVTWTSGANGGSPQVRDVGNDNSVTQG
jgi:hypothetical protein